MDEDGLSMEPYHDIHHHYPHSHQHRHPVIIPSTIVRTESTKSDNSLEEHAFGRVFRDSQQRMPSPHLLPPQSHRDSAYRVVEVDADAIQVIGEMELQQLPEAVNREILKNSREIVYDEEVREGDAMREENFIRSMGGRRSLLRYPLLDEERRSLSGSRRNLNHKNYPHIDDDKRSLNGSRNLSGSRKYILVPLERPHCWHDSGRNFYAGSRENLIGSRRNTGSREHLNLMRRNVNGAKGTKEQSDVRVKRHQPVSHGDCEMEKPRRVTNLSEVSARQSCASTTSPSSDSIVSPNDIIVTMPSESVLTPESGFAESPHSGSSPESPRKELRLPGNSIISRNRRSYENAQLQDVNHDITRTSSSSSTSDSDGTTKDIVPICGNKSQENNGKQTVSYTSV